MSFFVGSVTCMNLKSIELQAIVEVLDLVGLQGIVSLRKPTQLQWFSHSKVGFQLCPNKSLTVFKRLFEVLLSASTYVIELTSCFLVWEEEG